jgi:hypothetical protein
MANDPQTKQPQAPTDVVIAQLAEIERSIAELDKVIQEAQVKKDGFLLMLQALAPLVQHQQQQLPLRRVALNPPDRTSQSQAAPIIAVTSSKVSISTLRVDGPNTGFREAVRDALRDAAPKGLKPAELIKVLTDRGDLARYTGKVKPQERVYSELYSLKNSKEITKRYGRYVIVVPATEGNHA